ncbi:hypothetical protein D3C81_1102850 [compost metagenome]
MSYAQQQRFNRSLVGIHTFHKQCLSYRAPSGMLSKHEYVVCTKLCWIKGLVGATIFDHTIDVYSRFMGKSKPAQQRLSFRQFPTGRPGYEFSQ